MAKWSADSFSRLYHALMRAGYAERQAVAKVAALIAADEAEDTAKHYGPTHPEALPATGEAA